MFLCYRLKKELAIAIARAAGQGEDYLFELTNQICACLQVIDKSSEQNFLLLEVRWIQ